MTDLNLFLFFFSFFFFLCACVSGTTAKHVVFLAGNTAKHGLRCKACKMSLHHKCENGVGQQRCMGKLVRRMTQKRHKISRHDIDGTLFPLLFTVWETLSFGNINFNYWCHYERLKQTHQNWLSDHFPPECAYSEITLYVWVCWYICERHPSSSSSSSSLYHHSVSLCVCVLDNSNTPFAKMLTPLLTSVKFCRAAISINH